MFFFLNFFFLYRKGKKYTILDEKFIPLKCGIFQTFSESKTFEKSILTSVIKAMFPINKQTNKQESFTIMSILKEFEKYIT